MEVKLESQSVGEIHRKIATTFQASTLLIGKILRTFSTHALMDMDSEL